MNNPINNTVFYSRDLIDYKNFLAEELISNWNDLNQEKGTDFEASDIDDIFGTSGYDFADDAKEIFAEFEENYSDEIDHYQAIESFCEELSTSPDFTYGEGIIHENYWEDYCREMLADCGYIPSDIPDWIVIDYSATADNMSADYTTVTFEGDIYYIRG